MAGQLFDVFVVGSADPSPAGETRLATALASKHGVPLATVAKAISAKNLRAGQGLEQAQAQALVRQLQAMGAVTVIRPTSGPGQKPLGPTASPVPASRATMAPASSASHAERPSITASVSTSSSIAANFGPPLMAPSEPGMGAGPFAPIQPMSPTGPRGTLSPGIKDPFAPPPASMTPTPVTAPAGARLETPPAGAILPRARGLRTPHPASQQISPVPGTDPFQNEAAASGPKLELARPGQLDPSEDRDDGRPSRSQAAPTNLRDIGAADASGVAVENEDQNLNLVRCAQHGLYYDKSKASGCRKCLSAAREMAAGLESRMTQPKIKVANLRDQPAKRAFIGLAVAFVLGFLPAVYYAFGPGAAEARELRVRQELLSRQPGTEDVLRQFDDLDEQVTRSRERSLRNIALVWAATTAAAMAGWYKVT